MQFNYYFLKHLSKSIANQIDGKKLTECFSQNKNELILIFKNQEAKFIIKASLTNELSLLTFPSDFQRARKNSVNLFSEINHRQIIGIYQYENERSFSIQFAENFNLLFKLHGGRANVCLFHNDRFVSMFRSNFPNDAKIQPTELDRHIDQSDQALIENGFDLSITYPTFDKKLKNFLYNQDFEFLPKNEKLDILNQLLEKIENGQFYLEEDSKGRPFLTLIPNAQNTKLCESTDPIEICNLLAAQYYQVYLLKKEKEAALLKINKELLKNEAYLKKSTKKLNDIIHGIKNDELANILMANLHQTPNTDNSIELFDFYRNQPINIKLKKGLSIQANAAIYYKKAKNQGIEISRIKRNIVEKESKADNIRSVISSITEMTSLKSLRNLLDAETNITKTNQSTNTTKPYIEYTIDGYIVLVGKNAKSNDALLKHYTSKEDIWLHARDVSGSHVIIKKPYANISLYTIEKTAQIAAWYSKGKNDTLCPVIHTRRKYVSKPKGAEPGKVVVKREEVILVNPCQNPQ